MKSSLPPTTAFLLALTAHVARGHYTFPDFKGDASSVADWQYVRQTQNYNSQAPVTDVTSPLLRCYESNTASTTSTTTVTAGNTYVFGADQAIYHPGYFAVYMAAASDLTSESAGDGSVWFKIYEDAPVYAPSGSKFYNFPSETATSVTFTIPKALPSGNYLIRVEQIALHVASSFGGAQFYIGCAQVKVTGGGSGTPGPLVAIPGVYTGNEPGILINIYQTNPNGAYISPGPPVWTG
ncbi:glycoside hydrolase family 61 protein [Clavulina sp. PMI_390]|nr:glycoside hydrolase family 61 protein [Clavulina sp. PMI_390]